MAQSEWYNRIIQSGFIRMNGLRLVAKFIRRCTHIEEALAFNNRARSHPCGAFHPCRDGGGSPNRIHKRRLSLHPPARRNRGDSRIHRLRIRTVHSGYAGRIRRDRNRFGAQAILIIIKQHFKEKPTPSLRTARSPPVSSVLHPPERAFPRTRPPPFPLRPRRARREWACTRCRPESAARADT